MTTTLTEESVYKMADEQHDNVDFAVNQAHDAADSRSSSLSELDDTNDAQVPISPAFADTNLNTDAENDSEAETERLDQLTPKARRATLSDGKFSSGKAISSLSTGLDIDSEEEFESTPVPLTTRDAVDIAIEDDVMSSLELGASSHKRKRSSSEGSPLSDAMDLDEPDRKRSHAAASDMDDAEDNEDDVLEIPFADDRVDNVEDEELAGESAVVETQENAVTVEEEEIPAEDLKNARLSKTRNVKSKKKGKRIKGIDVQAEMDVMDNLDTVGEIEDSGNPENDPEEEGSTAVDEELAKKKLALGGLADIEKYFRIFRRQHIADELADNHKQMQLLKELDCSHPEYLAQRVCIDAYRDKKIRYEDTLKNFKMQTARKTLIAERAQIGSQYAQSVRHARDSTLVQANQHTYKLHRDRRKWGTDERNHLRMFISDRRQQVRDQSRYNLEVSVLSGLGKYVGFPAAPELRGLSKEEVDQDLRSMGVPPRPTRNLHQQRHLFSSEHRSTHTAASSTIMHHSNPERTAAAEEFYESTPWANPNHPSHAQANATSFYQPQSTSQSTYTTPATQIRANDRVNGSGATTLEALSGRSDPVAGQTSNLPNGSNSAALNEQLAHSDARFSSAASEDTAVPITKRMVSVTNSVPTTQANRDVYLVGPDAERSDSAADKIPPTVAETSQYSARRDGGLLGQRTGPFAVGVGGERIFGP